MTDLDLFLCSSSWGPVILSSLHMLPICLRMGLQNVRRGEDVEHYVIPAAPVPKEDALLYFIRLIWRKQMPQKDLGASEYKDASILCDSEPLCVLVPRTDAYRAAEHAGTRLHQHCFNLHLQARGATGGSRS